MNKYRNKKKKNIYIYVYIRLRRHLLHSEEIVRTHGIKHEFTHDKEWTLLPKGTYIPINWLGALKTDSESLQEEGRIVSLPNGTRFKYAVHELILFHIRQCWHISFAPWPTIQYAEVSHKVP